MSSSQEFRRILSGAAPRNVMWKRKANQLRSSAQSTSDNSKWNVMRIQKKPDMDAIEALKSRLEEFKPLRMKTTSEVTRQSTRAERYSRRYMHPFMN